MAVVLAMPARAQHNAPRVDLAITYAATHSNTTASNGFWLQGGALKLNARFFRGLGLMASATGLHAGSDNPALELACDVDGVWNLRGDIIHERKGKDGCLPLDGPKLSQLKAGEISKLELRIEHLKKFIVGLQVLKNAAAEKGIEFGNVNLVVGRRDQMMRVDVDQKAAIEQLISNDHSAEFWATLSHRCGRT